MKPQLDDKYLNRLRHKAEYATAGPYVANGVGGFSDQVGSEVSMEYMPSEHEGELNHNAMNNAEYFAEIYPEVVIALVDEIETQRVVMENLREGMLRQDAELDALHTKYTEQYIRAAAAETLTQMNTVLQLVSVAGLLYLILK